MNEILEALSLHEAFGNQAMATNRVNTDVTTKAEDLKIDGADDTDFPWVG